MIDRGEGFATVPNRLTSPVATLRAGRSGAPESLQFQSLEAELQEVEKRLQSATRSRFEEVNRLSQRAVALGGKRFRPMLALLSAKAVGSGPARIEQRGDLLSIASAVELVHTASLVHDDVLDGAAERRHQPTIAKLAGNSASVLLGDFLFTRAYALAASCRSSYAARKIAQAATELCEGELRQQSAIGNWELSMPAYRQLLEQKTASLCAVSCRLGAWSAGGTKPQTRALARFGRALGLAFQIYDDWLDYWGTEAVGKTLGTDLGQGKPTLPLLRLLSNCSASERQRLQFLLERGSSEDLNEVIHALGQSDASEFTLAVARKYAQRSVAALSELPESEYRDSLSHLAEFSVGRAA